MTNSANRLAKSVARLLPGLSACGPYMYMTNPRIMLRGFAFDMPSGGCYIWKYCFPLFANDDFLNLSLGYRLPGVYLETRHRSINELSYVASEIVKIHCDFDSSESIDELVFWANLPELGVSGKRRVERLIDYYFSHPEPSIDAEINIMKKELGI